MFLCNIKTLSVIAIKAKDYLTLRFKIVLLNKIRNWKIY